MQVQNYKNILKSHTIKTRTNNKVTFTAFMLNSWQFKIMTSCS